MTWPEYAAGSYQWPYLVRIGDGSGELLYYGARHTYSPDDPQIVEIERLWSAFRPDIAFNEGGNPPIESSARDAVLMAGEAGLVRFLAARDDVPVATLEPSRAEEVAHLGGLFPREQVKLFLVLRTVAQHVGRKGRETVDAEVERVLGIYNSQPGLMGAPRSLVEVAASFRRLFPAADDFRETPLSWFDPVRPDTVLNRISRASSDYRDRFMVQLLAAHVAEGQRVFAVVGGSHVVMQEPALRRRLTQRRLGADTAGSGLAGPQAAGERTLALIPIEVPIALPEGGIHRIRAARLAAIEAFHCASFR